MIITPGPPDQGAWELLGKPRDRSSLKRGFFFDPPLGTRDFCRGGLIKPVQLRVTQSCTRAVHKGC